MPLNSTCGYFAVGRCFYYGITCGGDECFINSVNGSVLILSRCKLFPDTLKTISAASTNF